MGDVAMSDNIIAGNHENYFQVKLNMGLNIFIDMPVM
jgi:hypothetical protein